MISSAAIRWSPVNYSENATKLTHLVFLHLLCNLLLPLSEGSLVLTLVRGLSQPLICQQVSETGASRGEGQNSDLVLHQDRTRYWHFRVHVLQSMVWGGKYWVLAGEVFWVPQERGGVFCEIECLSFARSWCEIKKSNVGSNNFRGCSRTSFLEAKLLNQNHAILLFTVWI